MINAFKSDERQPISSNHEEAFSSATSYAIIKTFANIITHYLGEMKVDMEKKLTIKTRRRAEGQHEFQPLSLD